MRVLDVGSGAGDVALLAAERVDPQGVVAGVDRNPDVLAVARERAAVAGFAHLMFETGDMATAALGEHFDAAVGRLVLMYQPDPAAALRQLAGRLGPGGIVAFQEFSLTPEAVRASPATALWQQFVAWVSTAFERAGGETRMGDRLYAMFRAAGLPGPRLHVAAPMGGGPEWEGYAQAARVLRSVLPLLRFGIATADEVAVESVEKRLRAETVAGGGVVEMPELVSAWARLP